MIKKSLLLKIFNAACMQRWNDKLRPIELTELDKQAHKMMIAYFLGKAEEDNGNGVDWIQIIEGGIYESLLRTVLTDIKPPIFYKIKEQRKEYSQLIEWAYVEWQPMISIFEKRFHKTFMEYFSTENENINKKILSAAHIMATMWEYEIIKRFNPTDYEIEIRYRLNDVYQKYKNLAGLKQLEKEKLTSEKKFSQLFDLCGQLRYQLRWAHIHRMPKTSVLGHLLFVAIITHLVSINLEDKNYCTQRLFNNFFTGLFHDLPEILTRDIVSPVKKSIGGLSDIIKKEEIKQMEDKIIKLLPEQWKDELRLFTGILKVDSLDTIEEFYNVIYEESKYKRLLEDISKEYDKDEFKPRDGELVKAADHLAAFIEAYVAIENGCSSRALYEALHDLELKSRSKEKKKQEKQEKDLSDKIVDIMAPIYSDF